jgi:hypothetical protein
MLISDFYRRLSFINFLMCSIAVALYIELPIIGKPYVLLLVFSMLLTSISVLIFFKSIRFYGVLSVVMLVFVIYLFKFALSDTPGNYLFIFNILVFPVTMLSLSRIHPLDFRNIIIFFLTMTVITLTYEVIYRFSHPVIGGQALDFGEVSDGSSFYMYKITSLMYNNSNGIGMHVTFVIGLLLSILYKNSNSVNEDFIKSKYVKIFIFTYFVFCLLSLSRAAIIVSVLLFFLYIYLTNRKFFILTNFSMPIVFFCLFSFILYNHSNVIHDASFITKFEILNNLIVYLGDASIVQILFGNVLNDYYDIYPNFVGFVGHVHLFDLLFYGGFVFSIAYIAMFFCLFAKCRLASLFIILPFIVLGLSNVRLFAHYLFYILALFFYIHVHPRRCVD